MPSLRDIRKRIGSVKNTQQITRAMKMVAAAKLRRAQEGITKARPYAEQLEGMLAAVASRAEASEEATGHPLLATRPIHRVELVVLTSDRGLAGAFNSNILRAVRRYLIDHSRLEVRITTVGRKARDFFRSRKIPLRKDYPAFATPRLDAAQQLAGELAAAFTSGEVDQVLLVYNEFKSAIAQRVSMTQLLPIQPPSSAAPTAGQGMVDFIYEPGRDLLLGELLPRHITTQVWRALLESTASEHGARMTAMESATKNAGELIDRLTLQLNRARQASITKELMEIVSGAEALK